MDAKLCDILTAAVAPYDRQALAEMVGALHLVPANMERALRLHALAHAIAAAPNPQTQLPTPTVNRLRAITALAALTESFAPYEDPYENAFSERLETPYGTFTVVNGPAEGFPEVLQYLLTSMASLPIALPVFAADLALRITSVLRLVDAALGRAGIPAGVEGMHGLRDVQIPPPARLAELRRAVTFPDEALPPLGVDRNALADVTLLAGSIDLASCEFTCPVTAPLLDFGSVLVLAQPTSTAEALVRLVVRRAIAAGAAASLTRAFHQAVFDDVRRSLARMRIEVRDVEAPIDIEAGMRSAAVIDVDGTAMRLVLITDAVAAADTNADWQPPEVQPADEPLTIAVYQSLARPATLLSDLDETHPVFALTAVDLRTLAVLEDGDPVALVKYIRATAALKKSRFFFAPTTLAAYYVYWQAKHSYYVTDEGTPDLINGDASGAAELREVARQKERLGERATYAELSTRDRPHFYNPEYLPLDVRSADTAPALPPFRGLRDADQELLMDDIADDVRDAQHRAPGPLSSADTVGVLNATVAYLFRRFEAVVATLAGAGLLEDLLARNEGLIRETIVHRALLPRRAAAQVDPAASVAHAELAAREIQLRIATTGSLRFLIEYAIRAPARRNSAADASTPRSSTSARSPNHRHRVDLRRGKARDR